MQNEALALDRQKQGCLTLDIDAERGCVVRIFSNTNGPWRLFSGDMDRFQNTRLRIRGYLDSHVVDVGVGGDDQLCRWPFCCYGSAMVKRGVDRRKCRSACFAGFLVVGKLF